MLAKILHFLIYTSMTFLMIIVILRFLLQQAKADFYNPLSQAIVKITRPLLMPLRRFIPGVLGIDMASIALMILLQLAVIFVLGLILGQSTLFSFPLYSLAWAVLGTLTLVSNIFFWGIIISIVGSWIAPGSNHPVLALVNQLIDPIMAPVRKILPPLGGVIDISPILVLMGLKVLDMVLVRAAQVVYLNPNVVIGVW
jgi:YggT family protein